MHRSRKGSGGGESEAKSGASGADPGRRSRTATLPIQRKSAGDPKAGAPEQVAEASRGAGAAIPERLQANFGASLGQDLSGVRVHTGAASAAAAEAVGAHAYTVGQDIHFAAGAYDPGSAAGERLLAHEVAHTVQQRDGAGGPQFELEISQPGDAQEVEADAAADAMVAQRPATISARGGGLSRKIMRQTAAATGAASGGAADGADGGGTVVWENYVLSANAAKVRAVLESLFAAQEQEGSDGQKAIASYVGGFQQRVIAKQNQKKDWELPGASAGTKEDFADLPLYEGILAVLLAQKKAFDGEIDKLRGTVDTTAQELAKGILDESEKSIRDEQKRYGIQEEGINAATGAPIYGMASNEHTVGLTSAAGALAKKMDEREQAEADLVKATEKKYTQGMGEVTVIINRPLYDDAEARRIRADKDLAILMPQLQAKYPILASFTSKEQLAKLRTGDLSAKTLGSEIAAKLRNIAKARELFAEGKVKPIGLERIAGLTRTKLAATGWQAHVVNRRSSEEQLHYEPLIPDWVRNVLLIGFAILTAIPATSPIGLAGDAAVATLSLPDLIKKYMIESDQAAMGGTDFGARALAVASEDPSLVWLAFEILSAGVAVGSAVAVFRQLAVSARRVMAIKPSPQVATPVGGAAATPAEVSATELVMAETELRAEGNAVKEGLGDKAVEEARAYKKVKNSLGEELAVALSPAGTRRAVLPEEIQVLYLKGKPGASPQVDQLAGYLQELTARKATELRGYAEAVERAGNPAAAAELIASHDIPSVRNFLKNQNEATFGTALQMLAEKEMAAAGLERIMPLVYRKRFRGIPDIQSWPNGDTGGVIFDWTTPKAAGKGLKYDWDTVDYVVEIIQPGP